MRRLYQLTRILNKLIYSQRFEKRYYVKAPAMAMATENSILNTENIRLNGFNLQSRTNRIALGLIGFLILAPIFSQLKDNLLLKSQSRAEVYDLKLYPAPKNSPYLYQNTVNGFKVYLGNRAQESSPRVRFEKNESSAEFVPQFANSLISSNSSSDSRPLANDNSLLYKNVLPGIDIKYSLNGKGIKEEIIINDQEAFARSQLFADGSLKFALSLKNAIPRQSLEGEETTYFIEPINGQYRFHIPKPFMVDATGNRSEAVELEIRSFASIGSDSPPLAYTITLTPDPEWLKTAIYPVIIDPSVVHDESSEFTGTTNRIDDEGSGTTPKLRTPYHELPADEHTVGLWHMNESSWNNDCSTNTALDDSGNAYHGKSCPSPTGPTTTSSSKLGAYAGGFDGSNDYLKMGDVLDFERTDSFTIEAWIKHDTSVSTYRMIAAKVGGSTTYRGYEFYTTSGYGYLEFDFTSDNATTNLLDTRGTTPVNDNTWHHVAVTYDGSSDANGVRLYVDGKPEITTVVYNYLSATTVNTASLNIGVRNDAIDNSYYFKGTIDEVRISDTARTAEEIKQDAQRFPYGVYSSDTIDLTSGTGTVASTELEWTDNVSTPGAILSGYSNFKPVIIDNTQNSSTLTNYQTKVQVDYDSNMQSDFDDLRFTSHTATVSAYGDEATFNSATAEHLSVAPLDSTHFVIAYKDTGDDTYGHAKIGTVSGSTISYGSEYTFNSAGTSYVSVDVLDSTHFVVGYWDYGGDYYGHAKIGTVSGSTITYGSEATFNSADSRYISVAALDSTRFVVGYRDNGEGSYGKAKIGTVSGSTITYGSEATFNSATTSYLSVAALDLTHFVVGYEDYGGDKYGHAMIGTVSGSTITYGSEATFNSATTEHLSVAALDSTRFVVGYWNWGGDYYGYAKIGTVSGSTITYGSAYLFNSATTYYISVAPLDSTHFVVGYQDFAGDSYGHAKIGTVSGSTISYGGEATFNSAATKYISVTHLDSTHFVVGYMDDGGDDYGHAKFGTVVNTNLDYWIETKSDGVEATVWVEVDTITASSLTTIWMWYGNGGASAASNGDNTFSFFDDFPDSSLDATKWPNTSGSPVVSGGSVELDTASGTETIRNNTTFSRPNIMEFRSRQSHVQNYHRAGFSNSSAGTLFYADDSAHYFGNYSSGLNHGVRTYNEGVSQATDSLGTEDTNWHDYKIIWTASNVSFYIDDTTLLRTHSSTVPDEACYVRLEAQYIAAYGIFYVDWVFVRQHTNPEPITGVGADIEFQTRTSADGSSWEAWKPTTAETAIASMDSDATNWSTSSTAMLTKTDESTIKMEGAGSLKSTIGAPQTDANTSALWHFEETSGTGAYLLDETANNNDGTPTGTTVVDGFFGKARSFDGSGDLINTSSEISFSSTTSFTAEAWFTTNSIAAGDAYILDRTTATNEIIDIYRNNDDLSFRIRGDDGVGISTITVADVLTTGKWYHVAGVRNVSTDSLGIYIDGILRGTVTDSTTGTNSPIIRIGDHSGAANTWNGIIDEVRISNTARTSEEIAEAYRAGRDHRLQRTISSTDLSGKTKVPFYFAADKQGTIAETYVGETDQAVYGADSNTSALWHLDEENQGNSLIIKFTSTNVAAANAYTYWKTLDDATTLATSDTFEYDVYLENNLGAVGGIDIRFTDTSYARSVAWTDQNGVSCHPGAGDIKSYAYFKWYHRKCTVPAGMNGKVVDWIDLVNEVDTATAITVYYDNFIIKDSSGVIKTTVHTQGAPDYNVADFVSNASNIGSATETTYQSAGIGSADRQGGAFIKDISSNSNHGTPYGTSFTQGKIGGARYFTGYNENISVVDSSSLDLTTGMTLEAWLNFTSTFNATQNSVLEKAYWTSGADNGGYQLIVDNGTSGSVGCAVGNNDWDTLTSSSTLLANTWYHLACTFNGSTLKVYINGKEDNSVATSVSSIKNISQSFNIGSTSAGSYYFPGFIDEARVSNIARTADEIRLAYQYGIRTHQINVDFKADLICGADVCLDYEIVDENDNNFTISALDYGSSTKAGKISPGDVIIIRENYNGTEYSAQSQVTAVNQTTGAITVNCTSNCTGYYDSGSTFPTYGYSYDATVFKWQREYWDLKDISPADRNATVRLGMRILDASEGFTMYLDDFRHNTNYLTDNLGSTITSTANRYIQYRAILSTNNTEVTPELTSVTLDYNRYPTAPTSLLTNGLINPGNVTDTTPYFSAIYNDPDEYDVANKYWVQIDDNSDFGSTIWDSGSSGTAMTNCAEGNRCEDFIYGGASTDLQWGTRYYWRIKYWDDQAAEGDWSTSGDYFVMKTIERPKVCVIDDGSQPGELTVSWLDETDLENGYRIEKKTDSEDFSLLTTLAAGSTSHLDNTTSAEHDYQYRIRANSDNGNSEWCTTAPVDFSTGSFMFEGVQMEGVKID